MSGSSRLGYAQWVQALKKLRSQDQLPLGSVAYGSSAHLLLKTQEKLKHLAAKQGLQVETYQAAGLSEAMFLELIEQDSLFAEKKLVILEQFQSNAKLLAHCEAVFARLSPTTKLVLVMNQDRLAARLQKLLPADFTIIPCFPPNYRELTTFIKDLAKFYQLHIDSESCQLLASSLGQDLFKIENEIKNLALLFPKSREKMPAAQEVSQALGSLREDHGFRLEEFILAKQAGKALNLLDDLLKRGESPLAILGILANHCRKAVEIFSPDQQQANHIPVFIQQKFTKSLRPGDRPRYLKALRLCHEADIILKTSRVSDQLPLSDIIMTLTYSKRL
ncbi:MAG: DNA polymerase III subunit delta [Oligoflexus sp.]